MLILDGRIAGERIVLLTTKKMNVKEAATLIENLPWHEIAKRDDARYVFVFGALTVSCKANVLSAFELARKLAGGSISNLSGYAHPKQRPLNAGREHAKRAAAVDQLA